MAYEKIKEMLNDKSYDFLRTNEHLGKQIIMLGLGGSWAYGTNVEDSDVDIRGIALNTKEEILLSSPFDQVLDRATDTTIYSFSKIMHLLSGSNPNVLEMLFLDADQYLFLHPIGEELIRRRDMFLSKRIISTFGGYARSQLTKLDNKMARNQDQPGIEEHILRSIRNASMSFPDKYFAYPEDAIRLYIDDAIAEDLETEIFMDINLHHYPLRDYKCMWSDMHNIVKDYAKTGQRAKQAMRRSITKHAMHLCRLQLMALEALEHGTMHTHRIKDHDFLMDIRNGKYTDENDQMTDEFFSIVDDLDQKIREASEHTQLPDQPDYKKINEFIMNVNERIILGEY